MAHYRIQVTEVTEYPETTVRYEGEDGKVYQSKYIIPDGIKYKAVEVKTGLMLTREEKVYNQDFQAADLTAIIKSVNGI